MAMSEHAWEVSSGRGSRPKVDGRVQLYENPLLEWTTRIHPMVPLLVWGPIAAGLIALGAYNGLTAMTTGALTIAGLIAWSFTEYALHRWLFHWVPQNWSVRYFLYPMHELHHEVQEWDRLVTPPLMSVPLWLLFFGAYWLVLGAPAVFPVFGGFTIGYLCYDYIHFLTHFGKPRNPIGRGLRTRHLQHHFRFHDRWYGVSSPLWDYVFGTHVRRAELTPRSPAG